jgi:hypothetical protein
MEVLRPRATKKASKASQANVRQLEDALGALGVEVRRRGRVVSDPVTPVGNNQCSPLVRLVAPAPKGKNGKALRQKFQLRAKGTTGQRDMDRFFLICE